MTHADDVRAARERLEKTIWALGLGLTDVRATALAQAIEALTDAKLKALTRAAGDPYVDPITGMLAPGTPSTLGG